MTLQVYHPTVIVCVPSYNEERFIAETLRSIKKQSFTDFKCVIRDNCSTDSTFEIARKFQESDTRFIALQGHSNIGSAENVNELIKLTSSKYMMIIGAHDLIEPQFLEVTIERLESRPNASLCFSQIVKIDAGGNFFGLSKCNDLLTGGETDLERYVNASIKTYENYGVINCLVKRASWSSRKAMKFDGPDHYLISALHYEGEFEIINKPLYKRRYLDRNPEEYGLRLRGEYSKKTDFLPLVIYTLYCYIMLPGRPWLKIALMPKLVGGLVNTYGPGIRIIYIPQRMVKLLQNLLIKLGHGVYSLLARR